MTFLQMRQKRDRMESQMQREMRKGNFDKADKMLKKIVDLDVKMAAARI